MILEDFCPPSSSMWPILLNSKQLVLKGENLSITIFTMWNQGRLLLVWFSLSSPQDECIFWQHSWGRCAFWECVWWRDMITLALPTFSDVPELFSTLHGIEMSVQRENIPSNFPCLENTHVISPNSKMEAAQEEFPPIWHPPPLPGRELPAELFPDSSPGILFLSAGCSLHWGCCRASMPSGFDALTSGFLQWREGLYQALLNHPPRGWLSTSWGRRAPPDKVPLAGLS